VLPLIGLLSASGSVHGNRRNWLHVEHSHSLNIALLGALVRAASASLNLTLQVASQQSRAAHITFS